MAEPKLSARLIRRKLENSPDDRSLLFGTSAYLIALGLSCNLSMNAIFMALSLMHRAFGIFSLKNTERKPLCAACLSLAWKHWEDREGTRHGPKIRDLVRSIYLLAYHQQHGASASLPIAGVDSDISPGLSADESTHRAALGLVQWSCRDGGGELNRLRECVKLYEVLLLRAFGFNIVDSDHLLFPGSIAFAINKILPDIDDIEKYDAIQSMALGIIFDFYRWPLPLEYPLTLIGEAAVIKAAISLKVRLIRGSELLEGQTIIFGDQSYPLIAKILRDMRTTYEWASEIARNDRHTFSISTTNAEKAQYDTG